MTSFSSPYYKPVVSFSHTYNYLWLPFLFPYHTPFFSGPYIIIHGFPFWSWLPDCPLLVVAKVPTNNDCQVAKVPTNNDCQVAWFILVICTLNAFASFFLYLIWMLCIGTYLFTAFKRANCKYHIHSNCSTCPNRSNLTYCSSWGALIQDSIYQQICWKLVVSDESESLLYVIF